MSHEDDYFKAWQDTLEALKTEKETHARTQHWLDEFQGQAAEERATNMRLAKSLEDTQRAAVELLRAFASQAIAARHIGARAGGGPEIDAKFLAGLPPSVRSVVEQFTDCAGVGPCGRCGKRAPLTEERVCSWGCEV